jgi:hypothetical protein
MAWPVSAVVTPPFTLMGSDGVLSRQALGYDHDAERRPSGVAPPTDILEVGTVPVERGAAVEPADQPTSDSDEPARPTGEPDS